MGTNNGMAGWNETHAWDGVMEAGFTACGKCEGSEGYSWNIDDIVEPLAEIVKGGTEVISTKDMVAQVKGSNNGVAGWNNTHAWDGVMEAGFTACGKCEGSEGYSWSIDEPELCTCDCKCGTTLDERYRIKGNVFSKTKGGETELKGTMPNMDYRSMVDGMMNVRIDDQDDVGLKGTVPSMDESSMVEGIKRMNIKGMEQTEYREDDELEWMISDMRKLWEEYGDVAKGTHSEVDALLDGMASTCISDEVVKGTQYGMDGTTSSHEDVNIKNSGNFKGTQSSMEVCDKGTKPETLRCETCSAHVKSRTTVNILKELRYRKWKDKMKWDNGDIDRILDSRDALPELLQDYERRMVIIGSDVVSSYPNLEVEGVVQRVKEAVLASDMRCEEFDYLEGVRYIDLNWTHAQCN